MNGDGALDIFLQPGEYFAGDASFRVRTLLGSCVSITLWHPRLHVGAMSHFLLPGMGGGNQPDGRYAADAMELMIDGLREMGARAKDCEAKIFGGGDMFPKQRRHGPAIGHQNGAAARELLVRYAIPLVSQSLFGSGHRQVVFDIASGDVWARQIEKAA